MAKLKSGTRIYGDGVVDNKLQITDGPLLVGSATSTGTESQRLQVTGGASFVGIAFSVGIGVTNPTRALDVNGAVRFRDALYDFNNAAGSSGSVLITTGVGVSWMPVATAALQGVQGIQGIQGSDAVVQGIQGRQGITGTQGTQGIQGITGTQGIQGIQGITGTQGIQGIQGITGTQGIQGIIGNRGGIPYTFSTTTTDSDPGAGVVRYNNTTIGSVTQIFIDNTDSLSNTQTGWYDTWDDSTNTTSEGYLYITSASSSGTTVNTFFVTSVTAATGYYKIAVTFVSGPLPTNNDTLSVSFTRTGDRGVQGTTGTATQGIQGITGGSGAPGSAVQGATGAQGIQGTTGAGTQGAQGGQGSVGPVAGSANQVVFKNSSNNPAGSANLTFDGTNLTCGGTVTANSDENIKINVTTIENALEKVLNLRGVEFDRKADGVHSIGFIAQEVEKVFPDLVFGTDPKSIAYQNFVAILVEAIKELNQKVDRLTNN